MPWTVCKSGESESIPPSLTSDRVCVDKPGCETAKDRLCTTQCPCASAEGVCTTSNQCVSGATCVAGSGKKVGRTGDTCLASHCNNDTLDGGETSVDCGGECGCRATFEIVSFKPVLSGVAHLQAMSRDGKRFGGYNFRSKAGYPAAIAYDGTVTELESYGTTGRVYAASSDGSVLAGYISCANPPSCTTATATNARWSAAAAPTLLGSDGTLGAISSSGSTYAGMGDNGTGSQSAFLSTTTQRIFIAELKSMAALTPDGQYVAGDHTDGVHGGLWFAQTLVTTKIGASNWTSTTISGANGTDPAVIGRGYISTSDSTNGFRWKGGVITELGLLAGGVYTMPYAVSFDGSTVVGLTGSNSFQQAFIWTDGNKLRSIVDELKARGLEPAVDLALPSADFLSDDGKTIVGNLPTSPPTFWRAVLQ